MFKIYLTPRAVSVLAVLLLVATAQAQAIAQYDFDNPQGSYDW